MSKRRSSDCLQYSPWWTRRWLATLALRWPCHSSWPRLSFVAMTKSQCSSSWCRQPGLNHHSKSQSRSKMTRQSVAKWPEVDSFVRAGKSGQSLVLLLQIQWLWEKFRDPTKLTEEPLLSLFGSHDDSNMIDHFRKFPSNTFSGRFSSKLSKFWTIPTKPFQNRFTQLVLHIIRPKVDSRTDAAI